MVLPFVAVFFRTKKYKFIFLNFILTALGWFPGVIHAFIFTHDNKENVYSPHVISLIFILSIFISVTVVLTNPFDIILLIKIALGYIRSFAIVFSLVCFLFIFAGFSYDASLKKDGRTNTGYKSNRIPLGDSIGSISVFGSCSFWITQWFLGKVSILPDWASNIMLTIENIFNFLHEAYKFVVTGFILIKNFLTELFFSLVDVILIAYSVFSSY
jgi:uncharacterized membrane protein YqaE (UPF0057 family)